MLTYAFDPELLNEKTQLFPDEIENDPWVVYHGTSSLFEAEIDDDGFQWKSSIITKKDVSNVVDIYTEMDWIGNDGGGFQVLKPYSLEHDFFKRDFKPIYFGETSYRSLLFATHEFAGGETVRALRKSIQDLEDYLNSKSIRDEVLNNRVFEYHDLISKNAQVGSPPKEVDLIWLQEKVEKLQNLKGKCTEFYNAYEYGVVYAVKFSKKDIENKKDFEFNGCMGLKVFSKISSQKIVGKIYIPKTFVNPFLTDMKQVDVLQNDGIIGTLNKRK